MLMRDFPFAAYFYEDQCGKGLLSDGIVAQLEAICHDKGGDGSVAEYVHFQAIGAHH